MNAKELFNTRSASVGVVGLGYAGLPLALALAKAKFKVIGYDIQIEKLDMIKQGISYIEDIDSRELAEVVNQGYLIASENFKVLQQANAICICVPTPVTKQKEPVTDYIEDVAARLSAILQRGQLIIFESTSYPGTTREIALPRLEQSGLKAGKDFFLAYSPERVDPTNKKYNLKNTPKLVGGYDAASTELACALYSQIVDRVVPVSSIEVAEITKLFENCFRLINIAYVNEFAKLCDRLGISIWEVIDNASTKPFGYMAFYPGPGIGGHCIPVNPYFLMCKAREYDFHVRFLELATGINEEMPYYVANKITELIGSQGKGIRDARILMLGVAYKKDVGDQRGSPAILIMEILARQGAEVCFNDPYIARVTIEGRTLFSQDITPEVLTSMDCVVIATDHTAYDYEYIIGHSKLVFDTRGVTRRIPANGFVNVVRLGGGTAYFTGKYISGSVISLKER